MIIKYFLKSKGFSHDVSLLNVVVKQQHSGALVKRAASPTLYHHCLHTKIFKKMWEEKITIEGQGQSGLITEVSAFGWQVSIDPVQCRAVASAKCLWMPKTGNSISAGVFINICNLYCHWPHLARLSWNSDVEMDNNWLGNNPKPVYDTINSQLHWFSLRLQKYSSAAHPNTW